MLYTPRALAVGYTKALAVKSVFISPATGPEHRHTFPSDNIEKPYNVHFITGPFRWSLITVIRYIF